MLATLGASIAAADPKREVPDYDGRGNPDADHDGPWVLWIPRVVLAPIYFVHEYLIRRPLGALVRTAERDHWAQSVEEIFTFGPGNQDLVVPTVLFDFGLLPSVGVYFKAQDLLIPKTELVLHGATWGPAWIHGTAAERYRFDDDHLIEARFEFRRAEDNIFIGLGPNTTSSTESRYGLQRIEGAVRYRQILHNESRFSVIGGIHNVSFVSGSCCSDPSLTDRIAAGQLEAPPGFGDEYTAAFGLADLILDSRSPRPEPGSGAFLHMYGMPSIDVHQSRSWLEYGGELGASVDLTGHQRVIKMQLAVAFVDPLKGTGDQVPFTEYPTLGGEIMPGFIAGWMTGRSTAAAQVGYTWPVWLGLDGQTRVTVGNAFGEHLSGIGPGASRWSWDFGLTTNHARDQGFEVLFGLGSETFDQGAGITSVRVMFGSRQGF